MNSGQYRTIELGQDCEATVIPGGEPMLLLRGEKVIVTQTLGDSATVQTQMGYLVRISAADSAALGLADAAADATLRKEGPFEMDEVIAQLKNVFDPEIPINVVDLGLIYSCEATLLADGTHRIEIKMSMTAPGCGMGDVLKEDVRAAVQSVHGVSDVDVELVWEPAWGQERMTDAARLQLGMY